ncbi:hypothetical protein ASF56_24935 [Methylobacterium sp. Leaf122]|nr:hypothetical protein [Methylobacterium sp. Leaf122]KQQ09563.1 hypothetical protein ASF56_24935 [Methylobacterium sp. Leaf122]
MVAISPQPKKPSKATSKWNWLYTLGKAPTPTSLMAKLVDPTPNSGALAKPENVTTVTKSDAFKKAQEAGQSYDKLLKKQDKKAEAVGREAIREMLRFAECFKPTQDDPVDEEALMGFLDNETGKAHGGVKNPWQRLAKVCSLEGTARPIVSKRGYVLAVLIARNIASDDLITAFKKEEEVVLDKDGNKADKSGMEKYIFMYKDMQRAQKPNTGPSNPYAKWSKEKLAREAKNFLTALDQHDLLASKPARIEDMLAGQARTA